MDEQKTTGQKTKKQKKKSGLTVAKKLLIVFGACIAFGVFLKLVFKSPFSIILVGVGYVFLLLFFLLGIPEQKKKELERKTAERYDLSEDRYNLVYLRTNCEGGKFDPARVLLNSQDFYYYAKKVKGWVRIRVVSEGKVTYTQELSLREFKKVFKPRWD